MLLNNLIRGQEKSLATEAVLLQQQSILLFVLGLLPFAEQTSTMAISKSGVTS